MMMWPVVIMAATVVSQALATSWAPPKIAQQWGSKKRLSLSTTSPIAAIHARIEEEFWSVQDYPEPMFAYSEECSKFVHLGHLTGKGLGQGRGFCSDATRMVERLWERPGLDEAALARMNAIRNDLWNLCWPGKVPRRMSYGAKTQADEISRETSSEPAVTSSIIRLFKGMVASVLHDLNGAEERSTYPNKLKHVVRLEDVVQEPDMDAAESETSYRHVEGRLSTEPKTQAEQISHETPSEAFVRSIVAGHTNKMTAMFSDVVEEPDLDAVETVVRNSDDPQFNSTEREPIFLCGGHRAPWMRHGSVPGEGQASLVDELGPAFVVFMIFICILYIGVTALLDFIWTEPFLSALLVILGTCSIVLLKLMWEEEPKPEVLVESEAIEADEDDEESDEDDEETDEDGEPSTANALPEEEATVPFWGKCKHIKAEVPKQSDQVNSEILTLNSQLQKSHQKLKMRDASNYHLQYILKETVIEKTGYRKELEEAKASISALNTEKELLCEERQKALDKVKELEEGQDLAKEGWVKLDQIQFLRGVDPDERGEVVDLPSEMAGLGRGELR